MELTIRKILLSKENGQPMAYRCYTREEVGKGRYTVGTFYLDISCEEYNRARAHVNDATRTEKGFRTGNIRWINKQKKLEEVVEFIGEDGKLFTKMELDAKNVNMLEAKYMEGNVYFSVFNYLMLVWDKETVFFKAEMKKIQDLKSLLNMKVLGGNLLV